MFGKDALAERLALHKLHGFNATQPASGKAEAADAAEGVNHAQHGFIFIGSSTTVGHVASGFFCTFFCELQRPVAMGLPSDPALVF